MYIMNLSTAIDCKFEQFFSMKFLYVIFLTIDHKEFWLLNEIKSAGFVMISIKKHSEGGTDFI